MTFDLDSSNQYTFETGKHCFDMKPSLLHSDLNRIETEILGHITSLIYQTENYSEKKENSLSSQTESKTENPVLCWDMFFNVIRELLTVLCGAKDFLGFLNLSLVCKKFHQFIKNDLIPNQKFIFLVQEQDLILSLVEEKKNSMMTQVIKGITGSPFKKMDFIFPLGFKFNKSQVMDLAIGFPEIEEVGLLINFEAVPQLKYYAQFVFKFGSKLDHKKSKITKNLTYSEKPPAKRDDSKLDEDELPEDELPEIFLEEDCDFLKHNIMISSLFSDGLKKRRITHACFCLEEYPREIREKYGYKGWDSKSIEKMKLRYEFLKTNFKNANQFYAPRFEFNAFEIFSTEEKRLIFNTLKF